MRTTSDNSFKGKKIKIKDGWTVIVVDQIDHVLLVEYCHPINGRQVPTGGCGIITVKDIR